MVEAQEALTDARNSQLDRAVAHEIQRLRLLKEIGILFVEENGRIEG